MCEWNEDFDDNVEKVDEGLEEENFESSFTYHAIPLDKLEVIGEDGIIYTMKELERLKDLREEIGE